MAELPIQFTGAMAAALDAGRKSQTRRKISLRGFPRISEFHQQPESSGVWRFLDHRGKWHQIETAGLMAMLKYKVGDRLWVREQWAEVGRVDPPFILYRARCYEAECDRYGFDKPYPPESAVDWRPAMYLPRARSRLTLTVTNVRIQRLQPTKIRQGDPIHFRARPRRPRCLQGALLRKSREGFIS